MRPRATFKRALPCLGALLFVGQALAQAQPKPRDIPYRYDGFKQTVRPASRAFDAALGVRKLTGNPREAENVDEHDQVRLPSTWWTPRAGFQPVTPAGMLEATGSADAPAGRWTIVQAKQ